MRTVFEEKVDVLTGNENLRELGWSSLSAVDFIAMCDEKLGVIIEVEELRRCQTVNDLAALVPLT